VIKVCLTNELLTINLSRYETCQLQGIKETNADLNIERYSGFKSADIFAEHLEFHAVLVHVSNGGRRQSLEVVIVCHGSDEV